MTTTPLTKPDNHPQTDAGAWLRSAAPMIAVVVMAIPFLRPFFAPEFPDSGDGLLNLYRVMALDFALQHGDLWPRFATALHFGFGSPAFNYYAPLSLYGVELLHLIGLGFADAYRAAVIGYALIGALGAYQLGRSAAGWQTGIAAAAAYLYAPPVFDTFNRLGQFAAIMLLPWVLWAFWSLAVKRRRRDFALAAILFGALLLAHNVTALYAAPLAALWAVAVEWWQSRSGETSGRTASASTVVLPVLALILAMGLTAFFWWPALAESEFVQLGRLDSPQFDYHNNFLPLTRTFALPIDQETGRVGAAGVETIGWPQLVLGIGGLAAAVRPLTRRSSSQRGDEGAMTLWAIFAAVMFVVLIFFTTRASAWLWDHLPLVDLLLFPSRLLFGASLLLALLAGIGAAAIARRIASPVGQAAWIALCAAVVIAFALPGLHTQPPDAEPVTESLFDLHDFERTTGWIGATSAGEFLPVWVHQVPHSWTLTDRFLQADLIARLQANDAITIQSEAWGLKRADVSISAAQPTTLVFEWFYFPGWQARIDGEPAQIRATEPEGLIALDVPEGDHEVSLVFGKTPVRRYAEWVSALSAVGLVGVMIGMRRRDKRADGM